MGTLADLWHLLIKATDSYPTGEDLLPVFRLTMTTDTTLHRVAARTDTMHKADLAAFVVNEEDFIVTLSESQRQYLQSLSRVSQSAAFLLDSLFIYFSGAVLRKVFPEASLLFAIANRIEIWLITLQIYKTQYVAVLKMKFAG